MFQLNNVKQEGHKGNTIGGDKAQAYAHVTLYMHMCGPKLNPNEQYF